jgi:hypothetical protein
MGANALGRKKTSDRRFQRIYDDFKGGRIELQTYIEKTCGLRYLRRREGKSYVDTLSIIGIVCGCIELGCLITYMLMCCFQA